MVTLYYYTVCIYFFNPFWHKNLFDVRLFRPAAAGAADAAGGDSSQIVLIADAGLIHYRLTSSR